MVRFLNETTISDEVISIDHGAELLQAEANPAEPGFAFGPVLAGSILIRGRTKTVPSAYYAGKLFLDENIDDFIAARVYFDRVDKFSSIAENDVTLLILMTVMRLDDEALQESLLGREAVVKPGTLVDKYAGLVLVPKDSDTFIRVGAFECDCGTDRSDDGTPELTAREIFDRCFESFEIRTMKIV